MQNKTLATTTLAGCAIFAAGTLPASPLANFFTSSTGGLADSLKLPK